jgi:hypothetical protein
VAPGWDGLVVGFGDAGEEEGKDGDEAKEENHAEGEDSEEVERELKQDDGASEDNEDEDDGGFEHFVTRSEDLAQEMHEGRR